MSIYESVHKMTPKEQEYFDLGYMKGKEDAVVHAHWNYKIMHLEGFRVVKGVMKNDEKVECQVDNRFESKEPFCSKCGMHNDGLQLNYCPNCGSLMDEVINNAEEN